MTILAFLILLGLFAVLGFCAYRVKKFMDDLFDNEL